MLLVGFVATSVAVAMILLGIACWKWLTHRQRVRRAQALLRAAPQTSVHDEEETQPFIPDQRPSSQPALALEEAETQPLGVPVAAFASEEPELPVHEIAEELPELEPAIELVKRVAPGSRRVVEESGPSLRPGLSESIFDAEKVRVRPALEQSGANARPSRIPRVTGVNVQEVVVRSRRDERSK